LTILTFYTIPTSKEVWPDWVASGQPPSGLENFSQKSQIFQFLYLWVKKNLSGLDQKIPESKLGRPIFYCGSEVCRIGSKHISAGSIPPSGVMIGLRPCASHPTLNDEEERRPDEEESIVKFFSDFCKAIIFNILRISPNKAM